VVEQHRLANIFFLSSWREDSDLARRQVGDESPVVTKRYIISNIFNTSMVVQLMYQYRLYPSKKQKVKIINSLKVCKAIYNELLESSVNTYKETKKTLRKFDYNKLIKGKYPVHSQVAQNVSDRVHKAFSNFFRRVKDKSCKQKGFPRFKSRVNSITFPQSGFKILSDKRLHLSKIGNIPIILHRIPKGKIKTLTIKQNKIGQWFAIFSCEVPDKDVINPSTEKIGIDVGLENFATLSNGEVIANPRHLIQSEHRLKLLQRRLSRKKKGSANRRKARFKLAKQHLKVANQRNDFLHKLSRTITQRFAIINVEKLNITSMLKSHWLAKSIGDVSWNTFIRNLEYKAVTSGSKLVKVNARNTSKTCSECGTIIKMPLTKRKFSCPKCGFVCHRDLNASINILNGMGGLPKTYTPVETTPLQLSNQLQVLPLNQEL
jgi:putative transposase